MTGRETPEELEATARSIVDSNRFMTLATADHDGLPWASPVWYAPRGYREFFWVSSPEATHSKNIAVRPQVAIVIFDSHRTGGWNAVYLSAVAEQLDDVEEGLAIFSARSEEQGFSPWTPDRVSPPARHRLYRAVATEHSLLDPHDERLPVDLSNG
ncbi:MAG TPA: pyridoxamine 5'-phosphate oxidase family protein [Actinomycetota bacterium]|nr:pyridoxamine 5'-phosphate oxidase family protein [Actinomycetota bacterium]